jgi:tetratricopeptide (TPR) repeat protein
MKWKRHILFIILATSVFCVSHTVVAQTAELWLQKGMDAEDKGDLKYAQECYNQAIKLEPALPTFWYNRGAVRIKQKQYSLAVVDLNKCISLDTGFRDAYFNRALALWQTKNYQFALSDITHYLQKNPSQIEAREMRYMIAIDAEDWDLAIEDLRWKMKQHFTDGATMLLAGLYEKAGRNAEAATYLEKAVSEKPSDITVQLEAAAMLQRLANYQRSMEFLNRILLEEAIPDETKSEVLHLKADNYFFIKEYAQAADIYTTLLQTDTGNANLLADYGHCLLQQDKFTEADLILSRALKMKNMTPAYAYLGRGMARLKLGKGEDACADWEKSFKLGEKAAGKYLNIYCNKKE